MNLLETPSNGKVIFEGKELTHKNINLNELRQKMGMVFQNFNLFPHKTVLENVILAPKLLKNVDLKKLVEKFEKLCANGYKNFIENDIRNEIIERIKKILEILKIEKTYGIRI